MYEPAVKITHRVATKIEDEIFKAIIKTDIDVDKEELIEALKYDRGQYEKGYSDGIKDFAERLESVFVKFEEYDTLHIYEILDRIEIVLDEMTEGNENA